MKAVQISGCWVWIGVFETQVIRTPERLDYEKWELWFITTILEYLNITKVVESHCHNYLE